MDFSGCYYRTLDGKGRVVLPPAFRRPPLVLTRAAGGHLLLLPERRWELLRRETRPEVLGFYLCGASPVPVCASSGRAFLPEPLRDYAGLRERGEAVLSGVGEGVLVSSPERWQLVLQLWEEEL